MNLPILLDMKKENQSFVTPTKRLKKVSKEQDTQINVWICLKR